MPEVPSRLLQNHRVLFWIEIELCGGEIIAAGAIMIGGGQ